MPNCIAFCNGVRHGIGVSTAYIAQKRCLLMLLLLLVSSGAQAIGSTPPPPPQTASNRLPIALQPMFLGIEFAQPLGMLQAPGDTENWYVLEKAGRIIRVFLRKKTWHRDTVLDIKNKVNSTSEGGLLGAAFSPKFTENRQLYVSYTQDAVNASFELQSVLSRFTLKKTLQAVDSKSERVILRVNQPYGNHNGGQIAFSSKGNLFYGLGDGGSGGDPHGNGQNTSTLLGAMLRINVNNTSKYRIPTSNPLVSSVTAGIKSRAEIYAWGFRNPWRWSFDRLNGELWLADVGQNDWEEINKVVLGGNYGWNDLEGLHCFNSSNCKKDQYIAPVTEYSHKNGRCSITGGYVYRGKLISALYGRYLYGDFCSGEIWGLSIAANSNSGKTAPPTLLLNTGMNISSFAEDHLGELYVIDISGYISKVVNVDSNTSSK